MLEGPEVEAHLHKTGHSHIDLILGSLAVVLSMVSVFIAVRHGETMERLVAANSWPNISYSTGNELPGQEKVITLDLKNSGVGPARIDTFELFYKDKPVANSTDLLATCCESKVNNFSMSTVRNEVLPARDTIEFLTMEAAKNKPGRVGGVQQGNGSRCACGFATARCSRNAGCGTARSRGRNGVAQCAPSQPVQFAY